MISTVAAAATVAPSWRAFHGAAIVDTSMVIFGGTVDPNANPFGSTVVGSNDLWVWSTTLRQWSQPTTQFTSANSTGAASTAGPDPQKFLSSIALESQGRMMSIVSNSTTGSNQGDLLILDTVFWTWSIPTSLNPGVAPASRLGAAVGLSNNTVFLHGGAPVPSFNGYASSTPLNDLTKLDASTFEWTSIANGPALMYHTMCKLPGINKMIIFGGSDSSSDAFNIVYTFDLDLEIWELNIPVNAGSGGSVPSARKGHSAVCLNNTMVVYGGGADTPLDDDVWVMDASVTPWVWNLVTTNKEMGPGPRTGHSALLNNTNILVWGGYGSPLANDTNIYILDTVAWQWTSSKEDAPIALPSPPKGSDGGKSSNLPLTIGIVCGSLALIAAFVAFLVMRRRASAKNQSKTKLSRGNASYLSDAEQHLSEDLSLDDKPSYYQHSGRDSGSSLGGWPSIAARKSIPPPSQGYALRSMTTLSQQAANIAGSASEEHSNHAESSGSADLQHPQQVQLHGRISHGDPDQSPQGIRGGSVASDPYYPAYLAENDEEDADRWTFASSLSFDQKEKKGSIPSLRYIPTRTPGAAGLPRTMPQSTANLTHNYAASRTPRRDGSAPSILSRQGSSIGAGSISLSATAAGGHGLGREGSIGPRETALFNSLSPLDRVSLMCSGLDTESQASGEDDGISGTHPHPRSPLWQDNFHSGVFLSTTVDEEEQEDGRHVVLDRMGSTSTTNSSTAYTTLDHPALAMLIQNLPARYLVSKSPSPIHGVSNDILFAVDSDTQQPIVIKSFTRREAWERECRTLKRLRGPCIVELKHMATLVLSETDDPDKPAKIRLTILERLDETLAQMLKNARKTKKLALREQEASTSTNSAEERTKLDLSGAELYRSGPALDASYIKDIVKGVLRCLTWCHSKKIVYCDLKPTNIMRNRDDPRQQWKLIDLEASRVAEEERTSVGTTRYCPPEVALAASNFSTAGVTAQYSMDLWAFGCLIYELFATRPLIPLSTPDATVIQFLSHPSPETPALPNGLRWASSQELDIPHFEQAVQDKNARQLIRILLHPDPQHRAVMDQVLNSEYLNGTSSA